MIAALVLNVWVWLALLAAAIAVLGWSLCRMGSVEPLSPPPPGARPFDPRKVDTSGMDEGGQR